MRIGIYTLGCKVNQAESAAMAELLRQRGHQVVPFHDEAEVLVINTCAVTGESARKARQMIRQAKSRGNKVAVCGCYSQIEHEAVRALGADLVGGSADRAAFVACLEDMNPIDLDDPFRRSGFELLPVTGETSRTRAFLKVEDGCKNFCTYCIIPYARGAVRSMPLSAAVEAAKSLAAEGCLELVLTGIELSGWGSDLEGAPRLEGLIAAVCQAIPQVRVRLGSLEPRTVTKAFCETLSGLHNLCPHFHLSLQSGCDKTLSAMGRRYDTARYQESLRLLRRHWENPAVTTDLICGFPGETEEDFADTLDFIRHCYFSDMHIFPYSRRAGTPAATMPHQVPRAQKEARSAAARRVAQEMAQAYLAAHVGRRVEVLFEQQREGYWQGHTPNYLCVRTKGDLAKNILAEVDITSFRAAVLQGELILE